MTGDIEVNSNAGLIISIVFGVTFPVVAVYIWFKFTTPIIFDKTQGYYWKSRKEPRQHHRIEENSKYCKLSNIHVVQIVSEYINSDDTNYYSYEINLVLRNSTRINVIDHGKVENIKTDANKLGRFLEVPVWDGTR